MYGNSCFGYPPPYFLGLYFYRIFNFLLCPFVLVMVELVTVVIAAAVVAIVVQYKYFKLFWKLCPLGYVKY